MSRTAVVFSPKYYEHNPGRKHPESAKRLRAIVDELKRGQLSRSRNWQFVQPRKAGVRELAMVHDAEYIRQVQALCKCGGGILDSGDTVVSPESYEIALYAAGGALEAVDLVMSKSFVNAFAAVRPPGHHAEKSRGLGFCLFNNVAIAAQYLLRRYRLKRVLILDIDVHHGNGTQSIFYKTDKVLYISVHEDPTEFPGTGFIHEVGEAAGLGFNVNVPLPFLASDDVYLKAMEDIVVPIASQYEPEFILVSAGFDAHYADPVGSLSLSALCYKRVFGMISGLAARVPSGSMVQVLEGGYGIRFVGKIASSAIAEMSRSKYALHDCAPTESGQVRTLGERIIEETKKVQRDFWNLM
jgi:acetoin utilization deacetylase AcuC-like enzyme